MANKTKHRILQAARLLFNDEGVSNVAMVDIAATLNISPGNLYYHYRGKEQLMPALFDGFAAELSALVAANVTALESLEDRWAYSFLLLDTLYNYRCLHGLDAIRFDKLLSRRYKRLQLSLAKMLEVLIDQLQVSDSVERINASDVDRSILAQNIALFMFSWVEHTELNLDANAERQFLHEGVYRVFFQIAVTIGDRALFLTHCKAVMTDTVTGGTQQRSLK